MYVKADQKLFGEEKAIIEDELNVKNVEDVYKRQNLWTTWWNLEYNPAELVVDTL